MTPRHHYSKYTFEGADWRRPQEQLNNVQLQQAAYKQKPKALRQRMG